MLRSHPPLSILALLLLASFSTGADQPYSANPEIVKQIEAMKPGESLLLPPVKYFEKGEPLSGMGREGPYHRDYTNKMVYAPERQTALYEGGNHGAGRTNDVWEFHLASNSWHRLHKCDGGDHARFKFSLMFYPRLMSKNPSTTFTDTQKKEIEKCKEWWVANVVLRDGNYVMKESGAPILVGHTWDTLMYDPVNRRVVHGTGAHCANLPWLEHLYRGTPLAEAVAAHGKRSDGTPWRRPWTFDPTTGKWSPYAHASPLAEMRGMGGSLLYIPDQQKAVWYFAGQSTPGAPFVMALWDLKTDTWEELKPNGGVSLRNLALTQKIAPTSEQQMVYATPHRKIIAVLGKSTYGYDFKTNEWSKLNEAIPFVGHDARTVFAYDEAADACLLVDVRNQKLASYDVKANAWTLIEPKGPAMPKPQFNVARGYYDPTHNVFVVHTAHASRVWLYRHAARP